jgi:oxygen-independent coproporphyrinogen-3 oxidase
LIEDNPKAAYIHIPFCKTRCPYCDFAVWLNHKGDLYEPYIEALSKEISTRSNHQKLSSIYLGGGTPSILPAVLTQRLFKTITDSFELNEDVEITIEVNPGSVDKDKLRAYTNLGINRLSLGVQSFNETLLRKLARGHNLDDVYRTLEDAQSVGFNNISLDLIYGLPHQSFADWEDTLKKALDLPIKHISIYALAIEEGTPFKRLYGSLENKNVFANDEELERMYLHIVEKTIEKGFNHYEVSNFARPGYESKHNLTYWTLGEYFGFGVSAHEFMDGRRKAHSRNLQEYLLNPLNLAEQDCNLPLEEIMLSLRLRDGLNLEKYKINHGRDLLQEKADKINRWIELGLVELDKEKLILTTKGFLVSNEIISQLI